jgi:hypothetical protein
VDLISGERQLATAEAAAIHRYIAEHNDEPKPFCRFRRKPATCSELMSAIVPM